MKKLLGIFTRILTEMYIQMLMKMFFEMSIEIYNGNFKMVSLPDLIENLLTTAAAAGELSMMIMMMMMMMVMVMVIIRRMAMMAMIGRMAMMVICDNGEFSRSVSCKAACVQLQAEAFRLTVFSSTITQANTIQQVNTITT